MLVKLFFSDAEQDRKVFKEEFEQILSEVPNSIGNKENFWIYFFLGSILTLPDTELQKSLNIQKVEVKISDDQRTLNLRITTEDKVICRSISTAGEDPVIEYKEDSALSNQEFIEITEIIKQDSALNLGDKVTQESLKVLFENLAKIYNHYGDQDLKLKQKPEALHQAFIYGFMKMNMKDSISCVIEFGAGFGIADLVLKIGDAAVIVECKADSKTAEDAINQIKRRGYFCLDILGKCKPIFLVGINFNRRGNKGLIVEEYVGGKPQGLVNVLMKKKVVADGLEGKIQKELEFLCYSKNIGICNFDNPSNKDEFDPKNKYVGSFTALLLGQMLQYCGQNEECEFERVTTQKREEDKIQNTELAIIDGNNKLQLNITEFIDKGGNVSPEHETTDVDISSPERDNDAVSNDGGYNIKIELAQNDKKFTYKIVFPDKNSNGENSNKVIVQKEKNRASSLRTRSSSGRQLKSTKDPDSSYFSSPEYPQSSSQESGASPQKPGSSQQSNTQNADIEKLIQEVESGKKSYLQAILTKCKDFINSEANLQLFLKGLFTNAEMGGGKIVVETEVSAGRAGKIDLLLKFPDKKGIIFELKVCDKKESMEDKLKEALEQLESYTNKGNLKYILDPEEPQLISIIFCKENAECIVKIKTIDESLNCSKGANDSGFVSDEEDLSDAPRTSLTQSTSLIYLHNAPQSSPSMKRKAPFP